MDTTDKHALCGYCGKKGHGKSAPARLRRRECPAYGHHCQHCNRDHHLESVCRSKDKPKIATRVPPSVDDREGAIFNTLCTVTASGNRYGRKAIALDHHLYDMLSDTWVKKRSRPQPFMHLTVSISSEDYENLGFTLNTRTKTATLPALADTGCQSCLAGIKVIHRLGLRRSDLIPVTMTMHAANEEGIRIIGATMLHISGTDSHGRVVTTRQMTYVTDTSDKLFISREACIALGIISNSFPTIGEITGVQALAMTMAPHKVNEDVSSSCNYSGLTPPCDCPGRQRPPPPPTKLPFPATDANRMKLEQYLLNY